MIFQSPRPPVDIPRVSVTACILERAAEFAERIALIDAITDRRITYAGLEATIARAAAGWPPAVTAGATSSGFIHRTRSNTRSRFTARPGWGRWSPP